MKNTIGIIGGMGPLASQLFYKLVINHTEASTDQQHINMIILSDASMPDRTKAILDGEYDEVYNQLLKDAKMLENCGCIAMGITCNTAHFFADMIKDKINIPIIHMLDETVKKISSDNPKSKVAILATDGTIKTKLYQKRLEDSELTPYILPEDMQKMVMYQIYERVKKGLPYDREKWNLVEKHIMKEGCNCAILGCTELSVIKDDNNLDDFYVDPMLVLAYKVITAGGGRLK